MQSGAPRNSQPLGSVVFALPDDPKRGKEVRRTIQSNHLRQSIRRMTIDHHVNLKDEVTPVREHFAFTTRALMHITNWAFWMIEVALLVITCIPHGWSNGFALYRMGSTLAPAGNLAPSLAEGVVYYRGMVLAVFVIGVLLRGWVLIRPHSFRHYIGYASNPYRWTHYTLSSPIISVLVAFWSGIPSVWFAVLVLTLQFGTSMSMALCDYVARPYGPDEWLLPQLFRASPNYLAFVFVVGTWVVFGCAVGLQPLSLPGSSIALVAINAVNVLLAVLTQAVFVRIRPIYFVFHEILQTLYFITIEITLGVVVILSTNNFASLDCALGATSC